jgi:hypothetical protein
MAQFCWNRCHIPESFISRVSGTGVSHPHDLPVTLHLGHAFTRTNLEDHQHRRALQPVLQVAAVWERRNYRQNDPEEQQKRMRYTDILANALMLQNVADLTEALEKLKQSGYPVNDEDVAHLSPYLTRHIQRFGDYLLKTWHETPFPQEEEAYSA